MEVVPPLRRRPGTAGAVILAVLALAAAWTLRPAFAGEAADALPAPGAPPAADAGADPAAAAAGEPVPPAVDDEDDPPPDGRTPTPLGLPDPWIPADNPQEMYRADLGAVLFSDPVLSRDRTVSCSSCHLPEKGYADGRPLAIGIDGQVLARHAPSLLNVAYTKHPFWDGRAASLEDQAGQPIVNPQEMDLTEEEAVARLRANSAYVKQFAIAFRDDVEPVTFDRIRKALAAYERTLLAGDSPFDRWWTGRSDAMAEDAVRGFRLFMDKARCSSCHPVRQSFALFTDDRFHATGAGKGAGFEDPGRFAVTGKEADRGRFKTPTLRNVALTAPYMHDGSLATLEEVVDFYNKGGEPHPNLDADMRPLSLTEGERADLVAFLRALTSHRQPGVQDGATLLRRGQFLAARNRFLRDLERDPVDTAALAGLAEASLGTGDIDLMADAADRLSRAEDEVSRGEARGRMAIWTGRLWSALATAVEGEEQFDRAVAHRGDAVNAFARAREAAPYLDDAWLEGATAEEAVGRTDTAEALLTALVDRSERRDGDALSERAGLRYRIALSAARAAGNVLDDASSTAFAGAADDALAADRILGATYDRVLLRARSLHWLRRTEEARDAYVAAVPLTPASRDALTGLASLLSADRAAWTGALEGLVAAHPDHAQAVYFLAYDRFDRGEMNGAGELYRRMVDLTPRDPVTRVFLGRIAAAGGRRDEAIAHFEAALLLDPTNALAVGAWEALLRETPPRDFAGLDALDRGYGRLIGCIGDRHMRVMARNNLGLVLWEAVSSWTSRGRGRMQYIVEGAPPEVLRWMRRCVEVFREAAADLPPDDEIMAMDFDRRWVYAGVLNDAGIMFHYFHETQDLDAAEGYYLRSFRITEGAYRDAYFYNLQFLYGFERPGNDDRWYQLAAVARIAILKEDPESDTGYAPDDRKRAAAQRDYERLRDELGEAEAERLEGEELPR